MAADVAQHEHSNIKCYASAFSIIQIKTILFIFYLWNPDIVTDNTKHNITKQKKEKKKKELNCFTCTKSMKCIPIFQTQTILMVKMQLCIEQL